MSGEVGISGSADGDDALLRRFLGGDLDADALDALELRLDAEPDLQRRLGSLAREQQEADFVAETVAESTRFSGRGLVRHRDRSKPEASLEIGPVIGEGGMGVVHLGRQHSVGRDVAVKTVRSHELPSTSLLEEAWVTGQLEHPNIVPIHDIATSADGRAQVVLKHIEGSSWSELIDDPDEVRRRFNVDDPLEWHLRVLVQICQALRFAHSRSIVHRDIKPSNVMIGRFDEVYLLDWGLAISTQPSDRLPTLRTSYGIAGSPAYMAPEQFEAVPMRVGFHTDVYLLGAVVYQLVTGTPPFAGKSLKEIREIIAQRVDPPLDADISPELVHIIRRAMSHDIDQRFDSVQAMRDAIEAYLQHRGSEELARQAEARAERMHALQRMGDDDGAERAFFEAAFGYRMALDKWAGNDAARHRMTSLVRERVEQLLGVQAPQAARRALAVLDNPAADLAEQVETALERAAVERLTLHRLVRDEDRRVGHEVRRRYVLVLGAFWLSLWTWAAVSPPETPIPLIVATLAILLPSTVVTTYLRREMLQVRLNRYITLLICVMLFGQLLWLGAATAWLLPMPKVLTTLLLFWCITVGAAAATVEVRILPTAFAYGIGFLACALRPSLIPWAFPATMVAMLANMLAINIAIARSTRANPPPG